VKKDQVLDGSAGYSWWKEKSEREKNMMRKKHSLLNVDSPKRTRTEENSCKDFIFLQLFNVSSQQ